MFVEGEFDQDFIEEFVGKLGKETEIAVFPINTVNIPDKTLIELELPVGSEKSRVTALAILLEQNFGKRPSNIVCLVDADQDRILQKVRNESNIKYTDFTCMEMYILNLTTLKKFFTFTCNMDALRVSDFLKLALIILPCQFVARAVVEKMGLAIAIPRFTSGLKRKRDFDSFDPNKYFDCFLSNAACRNRREEITQEITLLTSLLDSNLKHKSHGHDFIELMFEFLWSEGGIKLHNKGDDVQKFGGRLIATAVDFDRLNQETLFSQISKALLGHAFMCSDPFEGNGELLKAV